MIGLIRQYSMCTACLIYFKFNCSCISYYFFTFTIYLYVDWNASKTFYWIYSFIISQNNFSFVPCVKRKVIHGTNLSAWTQHVCRFCGVLIFSSTWPWRHRTMYDEADIEVWMLERVVWMHVRECKVWMHVRECEAMCIVKNIHSQQIFF